jgi:hypothetical protein
MHACKCGRWLESAQSEECAIHEANSLVLAWPVCFTGLSPRFFALLSSIIPCRACHLVHPSSLLLAGGSKHRRRWFNPPPVLNHASSLPPLLLRPLGPWASHSAPNLETFFVLPFRLSSSSLVSICRVFTPIFQTRIPLLHLESWLYTDSLPSFFPAPNTTQFFVLTLFASKMACASSSGQPPA